MLRGSPLILFVLGLVLSCHAQTTVTGTIVDPNGNPYANGTASAYTLATSGQPTVSISPVTTNGVGFFTMTINAGNYVFTICAPPFGLGPTANPTPVQVCFSSNPIAISGGSLDISAQLNPSAKVIGPTRIAGVGDPGSNGVMKRTALNLTAPAVAADIIGLWGGTCNTTTFFRGDGSCQTPTGGGNVSTTPGGTQAIVQPLNTNFTVNNFGNSRYAPAFNWTVSPAGTLTASTLATITLTPCPLGVNGTDAGLGIYIAGTGTPEALYITGGSCTGGAASGTIQFTPANSHGAGFTIQSGTSGAREAYMDNGKNDQSIFFGPSPANGGGVTNPVIMYTPFLLDSFGPVAIYCNNAILETYGPTNTDAAVVVTNIIAATFHECRPAANGFAAGATITNTACSSNVSTITSTLNPPVGSRIDIQFTLNSHYWGVHTVATTSGSSWTYVDNQCLGNIAPGAGTIASQATPGNNAPVYAMIEDQFGFGVRYEDFHWGQPGSISGKLNNGIVVEGDQHVEIIGHTGAGQGNCNSTYCGSWVYAPGPFSGNNPPVTDNAAVMYFSNNSMSLNCNWNGLTLYNGNTFNWNGGVLQGQAMWGVKTGVRRGGFGTSTITQMYNEQGNCTNPIYAGSQGVEVYGQALDISGGEGPQANIPSFGTGGGTTYYYYLVVNDSVQGASTPLFIGQCNPSGTTCAVQWPRANDTNTTTYDLIRSTDNLNAPSNFFCTGGSPTACGSAQLAIAQCATLSCSVTDTVTVNTAADTFSFPAHGYQPIFTYFPGEIVMQGGGASLFCHSLNTTNQCQTVIATNGFGPVTTDIGPQKFQTTALLQSLASVDINSTLKSTSALLLPNPLFFNHSNNLKGRLNFLPPNEGAGLVNWGAGEFIITMGDCHPSKTLGDVNYRPQADACDSGFGFSSALNGNPSNLINGYASPVGHDFFVNSLLTGSPLESLRAASKTFNVPVTLGTITGSTQCLHVNSSGVISGTSADCGTTGTPATFFAVNLTGGSTTGGIQEAITAAAAVTGTAVLPNGTTTACGVTVPTNTTVVGYGVSMSTVQCATAGTAVFTVTGSGVEMSGFTAKHITNTPTSGGNGITVNGGAARVRLHDLKTNFNFDGLNLGWTTYGEVTNVISEFNQNDGVKFVPDSTNKTNQWEVKGALSEQNLLHGFELSLPAGFTNVQATCPHFSGWTQTFGNVGNGWKLSGSAATTSGIADCFFSGTFASQNNASGYLLDLGTNGGRNAILSGVYSEQAGTFTGTAGFAQASQSATNVGYGIEITAACDSTFSPQITSGGMWSNSFSGIITACPETVITGVSTFKNGVAGSGSAFNRAGISVRATNVQVSGGTHKDSGGNETAGIEVSNSADTPHINDFVCDSSISTCIVATTQPANGFQTIVGQARLVTTPNTLTVQGTSAIATGSASSTDLAGQLTLSGGTIARSFTGTYVSAPICTATDTTAANAVRVTVTNTTLTITGTGTDVIDYLCIGRN